MEKHIKTVIKWIIDLVLAFVGVQLLGEVQRLIMNPSLNIDSLKGLVGILAIIGASVLTTYLLLRMSGTRKLWRRRLDYKSLLRRHEHEILILHYSSSDLSIAPCEISCVGLRDEYRNDTKILPQGELSERQILEETWRILGKSIRKYIVGWNIKNPEFGLNVLSKRYKELTGKNAPKIADNHIIDLDEAIQQEFGQKLTLKQVAETNKYQTIHFRDGKEELILFEAKNFKALELSVARKVKIIGDALRSFLKGTLSAEKEEIAITKRKNKKKREAERSREMIQYKYPDFELKCIYPFYWHLLTFFKERPAHSKQMLILDKKKKLAYKPQEDAWEQATLEHAFPYGDPYFKDYPFQSPFARVKRKGYLPADDEYATKDVLERKGE